MQGGREWKISLGQMEVSTFDRKVAAERQVPFTWAEKVNDRHEPHCKAEHWEEASQSFQTERRRLIEISNKLEDKKLIQSPGRQKKKKKYPLLAP